MSGMQLESLVGAKGFEPSTPASRTRCTTDCAYAPTQSTAICQVGARQIALHDRAARAARLGAGSGVNGTVASRKAPCILFPTSAF